NAAPAEPPTSSPITPIQLPKNPYNPHTKTGRLFLRRREVIPTSIDKWLQANLSLWPRCDPRLATTSLFPEEVLCTVEMVYVEEVKDDDPDNPFLDDEDHHSLLLTVSIPEEISVLAAYRQSPVAVLKRHNGPIDSLMAPDWCRTMTIGERVVFPQPRYLISEMFGKLATLEENIDRGCLSAMLRWAKAVSVCTEAEAYVKASASHMRADRRASERQVVVSLRGGPVTRSRTRRVQ
ncbi:hypothetical protein OF83DRAFT_1142522, partial [Amylostereum chailletii]